MKLYKKIIGYMVIVSVGISFQHCSNSLDTEVFGEIIASSDSAAPESTIDGLLLGVYAEATAGGDGMRHIYIGEFTADHLWNEIGGLYNQTRFLQNWDWDSQNQNWLKNDMWGKSYSVIRNANFLLEALEPATIPNTKKAQIRAEARFLRAYQYTALYNWFGLVPLRTLPNDAPDMGRATEEELFTFIETELMAAAADLPNTTTLRGKAVKGAAYAVLMKFYLNTKNWQGVLDTVALIDGLGLYDLYMAGTNPHRDLFSVPFEDVAEIETIYSLPAITADPGLGNPIMSHSYPAGNYGSFVDGSQVWQTNQAISGTKNRVWDFFYNSFDPNDDRKKQIINQYRDTNGVIRTQPANRNSSFKYFPDPNANTFAGGLDYRIVRYADVLLSKAEALNEINGPTQTSIDLINRVRNRAKATPIELTSFGSKEALRDAILNERGWEFHFEGKRREDLIRHGKFVSTKRTHPGNPKPSAEDFRVIFPIPQVELDNNKNLTQNPGY